MIPRTLRAAAAPLVLGVLLTACESPVDTPASGDSPIIAQPAAAPAAGGPGQAAQRSDLARMRQATARYQQHERALDDGFIDLSGCVPEMGHHFGNLDRLEKIPVDPAEPEILLYAPTESGHMRLVGVEFMVDAEAWHNAGNVEAPSVAGHTFDPPNPHHPDPVVAAAYTLHVWTWLNNPDGMFMPMNPRVTCD